MRVQKGRLDLLLDLSAWRQDLLNKGLIEIPVDGSIAARAGLLPDIHGDPADRIIVATALTGHQLVTADGKILGWPGPPHSRIRRVHATLETHQVRPLLVSAGGTTMLKTQTKLTYADYLTTSDDERYELLSGELVMSPSPKEIHQFILGQLYLRLGPFVYERNLGKVYVAPFDVVLSDTDVVQPDVIFVSNQRADIITADNIRGAPDLVVEILSAATAKRDRTIKLDLYAQHGVQEYWIVDPYAKSITVLARGENGLEVAGRYGEEQTLRSPTLTGFTIALQELF